MSDNTEIMKWLNQKVNTLKHNEKKEYFFNSEYAGRKVTIQVKIDAINNSTAKGS